MTKITSAIAAAFIASVSFAGAALADEGDYFQGVSKSSSMVDTMQTGSIAQDQQNAIPAPVGRGDYYTGANRPN